MERIKMSTDLEFSRIVHGLWRLNEWDISKEQLLQLIEQCLEMGITTFDHADIYGNFTCEEIFGEALKLNPKIREKMEIVTKTGIVFKSNNRPEHDGHYYNTTFDHIVKSAERSLQNFGTDYIDVLLIHRPDPFMDPEDVARAFNQLRSEGKVNYFGVSNFTQNDFTLLQSYLDFDLVTNQIEASVLKYDNFENETIKFLQEKRINPMIWSPLAGGQIFTSQSESAIRVRNVLTEIAKKHNTENISKIAYAWLLAHPAKLIPIVGSGKINRISEAVNALNIKLTRADWFAILDALVGHEVA
jgi:predicted oxidoreductase